MAGNDIVGEFELRMMDASGAERRVGLDEAAELTLESGRPVRSFPALDTERLGFEIRSGLIGVKDPLGQWVEGTRTEQEWNAFAERKFRQRYREQRRGHLASDPQ